MSYQTIICDQGSPSKKRRIQSGDVFGMLTTIKVIDRAPDKHLVWLCECECGNFCRKKTNSLRTSSRTGTTASCGCILETKNREQATKHGMKGSKEYSSWQAAKERCHNPTSKDFHRYGAVGVKMHPEWRDSFEAFYRDMGSRPEGTTLDRWPDPNGNYEPGNCRWATPLQQAHNRRNTVMVIGPSGKKKPLSTIAPRLGLTYGAAFMRLKRGKLHDYRRV